MRIRKFFERLFNWELWNFYLLYAPIAPVWFWYCFKSKAFWFFTPSNPTITFGGFEGESKREMYNLLPADVIPQTIYIKPGIPVSELQQKIKDAGLEYPFVAKPDVGMKGILFRIIEDEANLVKYHERIPVRYLVQTKIEYPIEISIFYYRFPWQKTGIVSGFIEKELLQVKGDGTSSLKQLIDKHPRAKHRQEEMELRHSHRFDRIIPAGEIFYLSFAGNHNRGAKFINLKNQIDESLVNVFDELSNKTHFYYGRYDIKTASIEDLKQGKNFAILEYNGAGAEPNHIYDCRMTLLRAYKTILHHWKVLFEISRYNAQHGYPYWTYKRGRKYLRAARLHFKKLEKFD
ncbi:hypothetical protein [Niabella ginsengisoli]|uniref:D-alanine--D-alanine ligase n=1 Tax=Niabella ginsengisoli TaxID=522298 RepID=A0ABS9SRF1_9BACT|nr:hypothetical protein [Niabella ginsengisoli]MCH5600816.1 hypothetical protein [Niabella ginsengisoli]